MSEKRATSMRIAAPFRSLDELEPLAKAGADEIYFGYLDGQWDKRGIRADKNSRLCGARENIRSTDALARVVEAAKKVGLPTSLALNNAYSGLDFDLALEQVRLAHQMGVGSVIISDIGLLAEVSTWKQRPRLIVSTIAEAGNSRAADFYRQFGVARVILPRHLTTGEMDETARELDDMEFEFIILNDGCHYNDGLCGFHHHSIENPIFKRIVTLTRLDNLMPAFLLPALLKRRESVQCCYGETGFEVHALQDCAQIQRIEQHYRRFFTHRRWVFRCGLCALYDITRPNIAVAKVAGRGLTRRKKCSDVGMVNEARQCLAETPSKDAFCKACKAIFRKHNGFSCRGEYCYFHERSEFPAQA